MEDTGAAGKEHKMQKIIDERISKYESGTRVKFRLLDTETI